MPLGKGKKAAMPHDKDAWQEFHNDTRNQNGNLNCTLLCFSVMVANISFRLQNLSIATVVKVCDSTSAIVTPPPLNFRALLTEACLHLKLTDMEVTVGARWLHANGYISNPFTDVDMYGDNFDFERHLNILVSFLLILVLAFVTKKYDLVDAEFLEVWRYDYFQHPVSLVVIPDETFKVNTFHWKPLR